VTIACPDCGTFEDLPRLSRRNKAICIRCENDLEATSGRSLGAALACSLATLILLIPTNVLPLMRMDLFREHGENVIFIGVKVLVEHGWVLLGGLSAILVIVLPFLRFGLLTAVLAALRFDRRPSWLGRAFRWSMWLDPWAMVDVYLLAAFVGYYRLAHVQQANVRIELGGICFMCAAVLTMLTRATLDQRTVWRAIGGEVTAKPGVPQLGCTTCDLIQPLSQEGKPCPRCGATLHTRKVDSMPRTAALLAAAFILFFPANLLPMNVSSRLGTHINYTIFAGIQELFKSGLWPLGGLIFCTSILIPAGKIFAVAWCAFSAWRGSTKHLVRKTKLFRVVAELGRWSKTDPFTIVFFVPLMNFGALGSATAGWGATAFLIMTMLTMFASNTFDPRLMWDAKLHGR
jgi:paraquat-inducible protein A